ncbi:MULTISPECIES: acyl-CoA desaturase [unclassified Tolypothrix]|uniref:acyl-CoA desaturase n=1 Tax=unclassified Tolypothrix TaxID=2649714 RepID=UPI0005EAA8C8|nr:MULTISPECIES: fatty acid desaturase [unclassified Tolypothrix]EKF03069.1 stearoyl-CoA 9-desaturase [Tolypothrix sp. PCC 7601]MBE9083109.1 fatty acid desaturase [Tolypothrix sp. LEGE 11397]
MRLNLQNLPEKDQPLRLDWLSVLFFGAIHALAFLAPWFFSWSAVGVALFLHWLFGSIGVCLGYHRLLSHRSFKVPRFLEYAIAILGALSLQGGPIFWAAGHRLHHAHTEDEEKDPYSARKGFWWSHMMWIFYPRAEFFNYDYYQRFAPDLVRDSFYRWLNRNFLLLQLPVALLLYALGGWSFVVYGVFVRAVVLWHTTWLINSVTHMWGYRTFEINDNSRNLWWAAILTYGEGWHNNHHAYPHVVKCGWRWWEIDITWWAIWCLKTVGLAKDLNMPPVQAVKS